MPCIVRMQSHASLYGGPVRRPSSYARMAIRGRRCSRRSRARLRRSTVPRVENLAFGDSEEKVEAIAALVAEGDPRAVPVLQALVDGELQTAGERRVLIVKGGEAIDARHRRKRSRRCPRTREDVVVNNRVRGARQGALAAFKLASPDRAARLAAAKELAGRRRRSDAAARQEGARQGTRSRDQGAARRRSRRRCS